MTARVLGAMQVAAEPAVLAPPGRRLDDATRQLVARERDDAHAAGVAEGRRQALEATTEDAAAIVAAIEGARTALLAALAAQRAELADALGERVTAAVAAVLDREPDDEGAALVGRLQAAVRELDEGDLAVHVSDDRHAAVAEALRHAGGIRVVVDGSLGRDDARVVGEFAEVDLRREALLGAIDELLATASPLDPSPGSRVEVAR